MSRHAPLTILHTEASQGFGGQELRIIEESRGLLARGHRVSILANPHSPIADQARHHGIPVTTLPIARKNLAALKAMAQWLHQRPIDIINTHSSTDSWLVALARQLGRTQAAIVRTRHVSVPVKNTLANRWLYGRLCAQVVTTGERLRHHLLTNLNLPEHHVQSVPTGVNLAVFKPAADTPLLRRRLKLPERARLLGIAATLRSWKGHDYLLAAFDRLAADHPDLHLVIAGDGPRRQAIEEQIAQHRAHARIHLLGHCDDVATVLNALDLFILPSYANEGIPQALMQAMACGLPVISTPVGAIDEIVENGHNGLLVLPKNVNALAMAVEKLLADKALRDRLAHNALTTARQRFDHTHMLDRMEAIFHRATTRSNTA